MNMKLAVLASLGAGLFALPVHADDYFSPTDERVRISLGAMYVFSGTTLRADSSSGVTGTTLDGENRFGLDKSDVEPKFQAVVRAATRHRFSFDYFTLDRSGNTTVGVEPIVFRNVVFRRNDPVQTTLNLRTFGISYGYSFWHDEKLEIAATLGAHVTDISSMAKVQTQTRHIVQTADQAGPVPTVGLDGTYVISKRFYLDARAQYLNVHVNNVDGSLGFYEFDALYRYRPNVALGLGYTAIKAHLASTRSDSPGLFDFNTQGPELFFRIGF